LIKLIHTICSYQKFFKVYCEIEKFNFKILAHVHRFSSKLLNLIKMDVPTCIRTIQDWLTKDDSSTPLYSMLNSFQVQVVTEPPLLPSSSSSPTIAATSITKVNDHQNNAPSGNNSNIRPSISNKPLLYIICEESTTTTNTTNTSSTSTTTSPPQIDNLGSSKQLSSRGYYEYINNLSLIHILTDRCTIPSSSSTVNINNLHELLIHELTHALDHSVFNVDIQTCGGLSCSEIRAAKIGECNNVWPPWLKKRCMKVIASTSTNMVFPDYGSQCVDATFSLCSDTEPLENIKTKLELLIQNNTKELQ